MIHNDDLLEKLNTNFKSFSKGQKQLANYIMENYDRAAFITAAKMGRIVGVSESTVVRFAYALGYNGYPELQKALQELIRNKLTSVQRIQLSMDMNKDDVLRSVLKSDVANIRATIDSIDNKVFEKAVDKMLAARRIYIVGFRSAASIVQFLSYYLHYVLDNVTAINPAISDANEQMIRINEKDVCIGISFPRYSARTVESLEFAKKRHAQIIAITDSMLSPIARLADYVLTARSDMASFADSLVAPLSLVNAIIVAVGMQRKDDIYEQFSQLESIWGNENVYLTKDIEISREHEIEQERS